MQVGDGAATVVDGHGFTYTAHYDTPIEEGDLVRIEWRADGAWFTIEHEGETKRYPLRHGNDPHYTELSVMLLWPNPFLPEGAPETGDQQ